MVVMGGVWRMGVGVCVGVEGSDDICGKKSGRGLPWLPNYTGNGEEGS